MNKNFKLFFKNFFTRNIFLKIIGLLFWGLLCRILINYLSDSNFLSAGEELIALLIGLSPVNLYCLLPTNTEIINNNLSLVKSRPRDWIINNDYGLKDRCRRKVQWIFFSQFDGKFTSFKDYKQQWDTDHRFTDQIVKKYEEKKRELLIQKRTLLWLISPKNR